MARRGDTLPDQILIEHALIMTIVKTETLEAVIAYKKRNSCQKKFKNQSNSKHRYRVESLQGA